MEYHELSGYVAPNITTSAAISITDPNSSALYDCCFTVKLITQPAESGQSISYYKTRLVYTDDTTKYVEMGSSFPSGAVANDTITYCIEKESDAVQEFFKTYQSNKRSIVLYTTMTGGFYGPSPAVALGITCNPDDYEISCDDVMDECSAEVDRYCETQCKDPVPCPPPGECPEPDDGGPWWILWMLIIAALLAYIMIKK
jgi:hypothetical protein